MHEGLTPLTTSEAGRAWLDRLPRLLEECCGQWAVRIGEPFPYASASLALPAELPDGTAAVVKVQFPHRESELEAAALAHWNGEGAVRLLAHDPHRHALLLERCEPGTPLYEVEANAALDVMTSLLPRLWKPAAAPFRSLADEAKWWLSYIPEMWERTGRPFTTALLHEAITALETLPSSQGEQVLVHQDLHAGNVLRARREHWLVIDPKPLAGEREFGIAALVRGGELGVGPNHVHHRLGRLTRELGLDYERARAWALAQTVAWAFEGDDVLLPIVRVAEWLYRAR
jgi:streptomycin 6-kinase